jgi:hypothetical protein
MKASSAHQTKSKNLSDSAAEVAAESEGLSLVALSEREGVRTFAAIEVLAGCAPATPTVLNQACASRGACPDHVIGQLAYLLFSGGRLHARLIRWNGSLLL